MNAKIIGEHIKKFRKEKGLTQQQLADSLFVSDKTISRWELGKGLPDIEELPRIAAMLNISIDRLVGNDTGENSETAENAEQPSKSKKYRRTIIISAAVCALVAIVGFCFLFSDLNKTYEEATYVFEAEESVFTDCFKIEKAENASGKAVAAWLHGEGESLVFKFCAERGVTATLGISLTRTFSFKFEDKFILYVNEKKLSVGTVPGLGWNGDEQTKFYNFGEPVTLPIELKKGKNSIKIQIIDGLNVNIDKIEITCATRLFSTRKEIFIEAEDAKTESCRFSEFYSKNAHGGKYVGELIKTSDENAGKLIFTVNSKGKSYLQMDIFLNRPYTFNFENKYTLSVNGEQIPVGRVKGLATDDFDTEACFFEPISVWIMLRDGENEIEFSFWDMPANFDGISFTTSASLSFVKKR